MVILRRSAIGLGKVLALSKPAGSVYAAGFQFHAILFICASHGIRGAESKRRRRPSAAAMWRTLMQPDLKQEIYGDTATISRR
jgi:hypothetical protein